MHNTDIRTVDNREDTIERNLSLFKQLFEVKRNQQERTVQTIMRDVNVKEIHKKFI